MRIVTDTGCAGCRSTGTILIIERTVLCPARTQRNVVYNKYIVLILWYLYYVPGINIDIDSSVNNPQIVRVKKLRLAVHGMSKNSTSTCTSKNSKGYSMEMACGAAVKGGLHLALNTKCNTPLGKSPILYLVSECFQNNGATRNENKAARFFHRHIALQKTWHCPRYLSKGVWKTFFDYFTAIQFLVQQ